MSSIGTSKRVALLLRAIGNLVASYLIGFAGAVVIFTIVYGLWGSILIVAGSVIALPFLAIAVLVLAFFHLAIRTRLATWCVVAPFTVLIVWWLVEYWTDYRHRGYSPIAYLEIQNVIERGVLVLVTASISALAFYRLERASMARRDAAIARANDLD